MKRGEIWWINLDPTVGAEMKKRRPAIIVSNDEIGKLPLRVIVPLIDWKHAFRVAPWIVRIAPTKGNGLEKVSGAECLQVRSLSTERMVSCIGRVSAKDLKQIERALAISLKLPTSSPKKAFSNN